MITVSIFINSRPILTRSGHRRTKRHATKEGKHAYMLDTGEVIYHDEDDGPVILAKKMLDTIRIDEFEKR